jgi:hypothetical protein
VPGILKIVLIVGVVVLAAFGAFLWLLDVGTPKRNRYLIPEGYSGWVCVTYAVAGKPPLPLEDGFRLVKFDGGGIVETSDSGMPGKLRDEFLFYSENGTRPLNFSTEMGGGGTIASVDSPDRYTFRVWVSSGAKLVQPSSSDRPIECGPARP